MTPNFMPLNANRHRYLKLLQHQGYRHARAFAQSDVLLAEFGRASAHYPIVFAAHASGSIRPVVLLSTDGESNAFVSSQGRWLATYVPVVIRLHPFAIARVSGRDQPVVCLDMNSELLSHDEGVPLFDMNGDPAPALDLAMKQLNEVDEMLRATEEFCKMLQRLSLVAPLSLAGFEDCFCIDEQAFERLSDAALCVLRKEGWLAPLYAHRISLMQVDRLPSAEIARDPRRESLRGPPVGRLSA